MEEALPLIKHSALTKLKRKQTSFPFLSPKIEKRHKTARLCRISTFEDTFVVNLSVENPYQDMT